MHNPKEINGATSSGLFQPPSKLTIDFMNDLWKNIRLIVNSNEALVENDSNQLLRAITKQSLATNYTDTGTQNNIQLTNNGLGGETLYDGLTVIFTPANTNTGASTLKLKNLDTKPLKDKNGADLTADFLITTSKYLAVFNGTEFRCIVVIDKETLEQNVAVGDMIITTTSIVRPGFLVADGSILNNTSYPRLRAFAEADGWKAYTDNGDGTFKIPDLRGKFFRMVGGNAASLGATQGDAIRNITGSTGASQPDHEVSSTNVGVLFTTKRTGTWESGSSTSNNIETTNIDASRQVPTANENRPINMALNYIIKY